MEAQGRNSLKRLIPHASKACVGMQFHLSGVQETCHAFVGCVPWPQHYSCSDMRSCNTCAFCQLPWLNVWHAGNDLLQGNADGTINEMRALKEVSPAIKCAIASARLQPKPRCMGFRHMLHGDAILFV